MMVNKMIQSYILQKNLMQRYMMFFNDYMVYTVYGDNVLRAEDLLQAQEEEEA